MEFRLLGEVGEKGQIWRGSLGIWGPAINDVTGACEIFMRSCYCE